MSGKSDSRSARSSRTSSAPTGRPIRKTRAMARRRWEITFGIDKAVGFRLRALAEASSPRPKADEGPVLQAGQGTQGADQQGVGFARRDARRNERAARRNGCLRKFEVRSLKLEVSTAEESSDFSLQTSHF